MEVILESILHQLLLHKTQIKMQLTITNLKKIVLLIKVSLKKVAPKERKHNKLA